MSRFAVIPPKRLVMPETSIKLTKPAARRDAA
jgi:hypothetical protein